LCRPLRGYAGFMTSEHFCSICGAPVGGDSPGVQRVTPMDDGSFTSTWFCAEHTPSPPTAEQIADRERQEIEAAAAFVRNESHRIRALMELDRPLSTVDRANIGILLHRLHQRVSALGNELRALRGEPPIPIEPLGHDASPTSAVDDQPLRPQYTIAVDYRGEPLPGEPFVDIENARFREFIAIVQSAGGEVMSLMPDERSSSLKFTFPDDREIDDIRQEIDATGRLRVRTVHYSANPPYSPLETIWTREEDL
jgi:hypothetical protein